ncbi:MAG: tetratricopeptide repeat protein [Gaiellaceae bacterium]
MRRHRWILVAAAAGLTAVAVTLGGVLHESSSPAPAEAAAPASALVKAPPGDTVATVTQLQAKLRSNPDDVSALDSLGLAYQQRARETGDPTYYTKSGEALHRALSFAPHDLIATSGLGSLALSRHRFREALVLGRRARAISPTTARNYGVIGDALVELGRYHSAFKTFDTMAAMQPGLSSYARVAHARQLLGDVPGAIAAMRLAADAAQGQGEADAWTHVQLGLIYLSVGKYRAAATQDRQALYVFPDYALALDALARAEAGLGRYREALRDEQEAVNRIPLPQYVATLGDLYAATGRPGLARKQYELIGVIQRLLVANGVKTDLETALFNVDHGIRLQASLALARLAWRERPSIDGDDVLAWALERTGHCGEALRFSERALRLGTLDALKYFHRGMIEGCLGDRAEQRVWLRRALRLSPEFSILWAPVARRELR